ncbi:MAG: hypothetical protein ACK58X_15625 [Planctomycetota bacterium]
MLRDDERALRAKETTHMKLDTTLVLAAAALLAAYGSASTAFAAGAHRCAPGVRAVGQDPSGDAKRDAELAAWRRAQLRAAAAEARRTGRPLLVLLVPERKDAREAGHGFGALLRHGDDAFQFDAAACVLACAPAPDVQAELGAAAAAAAPSPCEVALLVVDLPASAKAAPSKVTRIEPALHFRTTLTPEPTTPDEPPGPRHGSDLAWQRDWRTAGVRTLSAAVHAAARKPGVDASAAATAAERALTAAERDVAESWLRDGAESWLCEGGDLDPALLQRAAAYLRQLAQALPAPRRTQALADLASALRATAAERPVAGAVWADANCPPCGMAAVSPLCERFLEFFAQPRQ